MRILPRLFQYPSIMRAILLSCLLLINSACTNHMADVDNKPSATKQQKNIPTTPSKAAKPKARKVKAKASKLKTKKVAANKKLTKRAVAQKPVRKHTKVKPRKNQQKAAAKRVAPKKVIPKKVARKAAPKPRKSRVHPKKLLKPIPMKLPVRQKLAGKAIKLPPQKKRAIENAVKKVIPRASSVNTLVDVIQKPALKHPTIIVSHLLEGRSADDTDSRVRGDYGSHKKLTALSQQRSFEILKAVISNTAQQRGSEFIVNISHGVRPYDLEKSGGKMVKVYGKPYAKNFYSTAINIERIPVAKWRSMGLNAFAQNWEVERNTISSLEFD